MTERLFIAAQSNWSVNAVAGGKYSEPYSYMEGYYRAGEKLAAFAINERRNMDVLFFPICFNYRHYVELTLKHLILAAEKYYFALNEIQSGSTGSKLNQSFLIPKKRKFWCFVPNSKIHARILWKSNPKKKIKLNSTHSLKVLLQWLIDRLKTISNQKFDNDIRNTILELGKMDPKGQSFRYGLLKNGVFSIESQRHFNLEVIYKNMEQVYYYLSGIDIFLTERTEQAMDYLSIIQEEIRELENDALPEIMDFSDYDY